MLEIWREQDSFGFRAWPMWRRSKNPETLNTTTGHLARFESIKLSAAEARPQTFPRTWNPCCSHFKWKAL